MSVPFLESVLLGAILSGTPLLYAALGEVIEERAGIVNLGLEGVMLMGAVTSFAITVQTGSAALGVLAGATAGSLFNLILALLVVTRRANQLASGLALMFFGVGLSALLGAPYVGSRIAGLNPLEIPALAHLPYLGALFRSDILAYLAMPAAAMVWWGVFRTRWGLSRPAVGENPTAACASCYSPQRISYQALCSACLFVCISVADVS